MKIGIFGSFATVFVHKPLRLDISFKIVFKKSYLKYCTFVQNEHNIGHVFIAVYFSQIISNAVLDINSESMKNI